MLISCQWVKTRAVTPLSRTRCYSNMENAGTEDELNEEFEPVTITAASISAQRGMAGQVPFMAPKGRPGLNWLL